MGRISAGVAALVTGALAGCSTPGAPISPDPVRFLLADAGEPCRVVFGPLTPDGILQIREVGRIDAPSGTTHLSRATSLAAEEGEPDLEISGIDVRLSTVDGQVSVTWRLPPTTIGFTTPLLDEAAVRSLLPELVATADTSSLARALAAHIDGADVTYAGRAPDYDIGLTYDDGVLLVAGRGVEHDRLDAYFGLLGAERDGEAWRTDALAGTASRAAGATLVMTSERSPEPAEPAASVALLDGLLGGGATAISITDGALTAAAPTCSGAEPEASEAVEATVTAVSIAESDIGDVLRITFDGLPPDSADPQLLHVTVGAVELVARYQGGPTVDFPATLTHDESRLLADRLVP